MYGRLFLLQISLYQRVSSHTSQVPRLGGALLSRGGSGWTKQTVGFHPRKRCSTRVGPAYSIAQLIKPVLHPCSCISCPSLGKFGDPRCFNGQM